jgi:uncharacterized protein
MDELRRQTKALFDVYHFPGHDYKHVFRVSKLAKVIAESEGYDQEEAEIAGLLHDVGRTVENPTQPHAKEGAPIARELLDSYTDLPQDAKDRIVTAVSLHSDPYTTGTLNNIVQDADKLDGLGAMGVVRAYTSLPGKPDYDPSDIIPKPGEYGDFKNAHHLMSYILQWYDMLYFDKSRKIGKPRHEYFKNFLQTIKKEIEESE